MRLYIGLALFAVVLSQDTSYCPDGWNLSEFGGKRECVYFGNVQEQVTKEDAGVLCAARGGWLLDLDETRGPAKNNFIKSLLANHVGTGDWGEPGYQWGFQWWIGATCYGRHSEHNWGNWTWDHDNEQVQWFDWMNGEPNDFDSQDCMTYLKNQDPFGNGVWHWNDWACSNTAGYICEKPANE